MVALREYQEAGVRDIAVKLAQGAKKVIFQAPTGGGKTVIFVAIVSRYLKKNPTRRVLILVHRVELLSQAVRSFRKMGVDCDTITATDYSLPMFGQVFVAMVETFHRRLNKDPEWIDKVGLMIVDEAHIASHHKVVTAGSELNPEMFIVGVTATPISSSIKRPMKKYYDDIVSSLSIKELIGQGFLVQNKTFVPAEIVDRKSLSVKGGDYDEGAMGSVFSGGKVVKSVIDIYERVAPGTKAIVFNCNIEHSLLVEGAFSDAGYAVRHVDGTTDKGERKRIFKWFGETPGAILCNVGIATMGYDEPSIETVILNRATMSVALMLQMVGRGSRPYRGKDHFNVLDIGGSVLDLGDWSDDRNWEIIFHNHKKHRAGVAPIKECPSCGYIVPAGTRACPECGHQYTVEAEELKLSGKVLEFSKGIVIEDMIKRNEQRGYKDFYTFFEIGRKLRNNARRTMQLTPEVIEVLAGEYEVLARQWCKERGKKFGQWYRDMIYQVLRDEQKQQQ